MQQAEEDNQKHSKTIYDRCIQNYVQRVTTWHLPIHLQSFLVDLLHASNCFLVICPTYRVATRENSHNIPWRKKVFCFSASLTISWECRQLSVHEVVVACCYTSWDSPPPSPRIQNKLEPFLQRGYGVIRKWLRLTRVPGWSSWSTFIGCCKYACSHINVVLDWLIVVGGFIRTADSTSWFCFLFL